MFKVNDEVRVLGEPVGSYNEFAVVKSVSANGDIWIANMNMPYSGTISRIIPAAEITAIVEAR